jgi:glycosyltransferase involved in cell wall biosynthesis
MALSQGKSEHDGLCKGFISLDGGVTMPREPLVSVLINNYNYGRYVGQAIDSALNQTYRRVEVIVVDDGSTDSSREVIGSYGDRVVAILKDNGGQTSALNAGFAASSGEWIHLLDSDDLLNPDKVQRISELAAQFPSAGMIAHDLEYCDASGEPVKFAPPYIAAQKLVDDRQLARRGKLSVSLPATSGLSVRRDVLERILPIPEVIRVGTDNFLKWVTLSLFPVLMVPECLAKQRIHGSNLYTIAAETGDANAKLRLATTNATLTYNMKKEHPHLTRLAWKQYGRIIYGLRSCKSEEARRIENDIRARYSVIERSPSCFFYVAAAFTKAYVEDVLGKNRKRALA